MDKHCVPCGNNSITELLLEMPPKLFKNTEKYNIQIWGARSILFTIWGKLVTKEVSYFLTVEQIYWHLLSEVSILNLTPFIVYAQCSFYSATFTSLKAQLKQLETTFWFQL